MPDKLTPESHYVDFDSLNLNIPPEKLNRLKKINRLLDPRSHPDQKYWQPPPFDPRFPNTNQTMNCYQNYLDYHRCLKKRPGWEACDWYKNAYTHLCPPEWVTKFDWQRKRGIFPGDI